MQCSIETNKPDYNEKKNDIEFICNMKIIHLEWLGIGKNSKKIFIFTSIILLLEKIENLNIFTNLKILYLQHVQKTFSQIMKIIKFLE